ncbi:MAG: lysylphosphatidylglycerol synthase transmembrane domain-containing protein [Gemmatimonadales bacterium]
MVVSAALLWWALRDVHLGDVAQHLGEARWSWLLASVVVATLTFPLRAIRWRYLLRLEGAPLPLAPLWHATAVGFMANNVLPARAGEFARAFMARRLTGVRFTTAFGSVAVERVLDGMTLVAMLLVATAAGGLDPDTTVGNVTIGGVTRGAAMLFGAVLVAAFLVVRWPGPVLRLTGRVLPARLHNLIEGLIAGLDALAAPSRLAAALAWSAVVWSTAALSFWLAFQAFAIDVPWSAALMVQGLLAFGVAVPSAPGFAGVFEAVVKASLLLYGIGETAAVSLAIGYHISTWFPITALGFWSLFQTGLRMRDLRETGDGRRETGDGRRET